MNGGPEPTRELRTNHSDNCNRKVVCPIEPDAVSHPEYITVCWAIRRVA